MLFKHPLRYSRYSRSKSFNCKITKYSIAGMRYPASVEHHGFVLHKQYWAKRLGLCNFAHQQLHKRKKYGLRKRWHIRGLNDTFDRILTIKKKPFI